MSKAIFAKIEDLTKRIFELEQRLNNVVATRDEREDADGENRDDDRTVASRRGPGRPRKHSAE